MTALSFWNLKRPDGTKRNPLLICEESLLFSWVRVQDGLKQCTGSTQSFETSRGGDCELPGCLWVHSTPEWNCRQSEVPRELVPKYKFWTCLPSAWNHSLWPCHWHSVQPHLLVWALCLFPARLKATLFPKCFKMEPNCPCPEGAKRALAGGGGFQMSSPRVP